MNYLSVCSGIEAASVAWHPLGWRPVAFAEIDSQASAVLAHHYPGVPNLGDFTQIGADSGPIDVLVGGTPCQSFSVAGLRGGLADARGNLALEYLRLADRLRPRWLVWENVPGVLSSNKGRDFGAFLGGLGELGYGFAYRVLDAQYFGLAQRRKRVFVVGHLGGWRGAAEVLLEREGMLGHPAPRREAGQGVAASITASLGRRNGQPDGGDTEGHLIASSGAVPRPLTSHPGGSRLDLDTETLIAHTLRAEGHDASEDGTGREIPLIPFDTTQITSAGNVSNPRPGDPCHPLSAHAHAPAIAYQCHGSNVGEAGTLRKGNGNITGGVPFVVNAAESCARKDHARQSDLARGLDSQGSFAANQGGTVVVNDPAIAFMERGREQGRTVEWQEELAYTQDVKSSRWVGRSAGVRRLTPVECERLQGFPDGYTDVPWKNGRMPDSARYRMLGNSMAVPVMAWIGKRIAASETG